MPGGSVSPMRLDIGQFVGFGLDIGGRLEVDAVGVDLDDARALRFQFRRDLLDDGLARFGDAPGGVVVVEVKRAADVAVERVDDAT